MIYVKCNLCGADDTKRVLVGRDRLLQTDQQEFSVVQCRRCSLVYLNPQPIQKELEKYYSSDYGPFQQKEMFKYGPLSRLLKKLLAQVRSPRATPEKLPPDQSALNYLDFGCGDGKEMEQVRSLHPNWRIFGLDNNQIACERARARGFEVYCDDISEVGLPTSFFDQVMMSSVIEHVNDPRLVLTRLNQAMKPGAEITIRTPNFASLARLIFGTYWYALDTPRHLYLFSKNTLLRLLQETGFQIKKIEYKKGPSVEIKSFYYLVNRADRRMNPIVWRVLMPVTNFLRFAGLASTLIVYAKKVDTISTAKNLDKNIISC